MAGTNDIIGIAAAIAKSVPGTAGAAAVAAKEAAEAAADEAQEILESIPEDYSELSADVSDLKSAVTSQQTQINGKASTTDLAAETARAESEEARIEALFTEPTQEAVDNWLDEHPEATTTVQDGSLTLQKFTETLKLKTVNAETDIRLYGAVGDGVTDCTEAFNNAIAYVVSNGGGTVKVPVGVFVVQQIVIPPLVTIKGENSAAGVQNYYGDYTGSFLSVIKQNTAATVTLIKFENNSYSNSLEGVMLVGNANFGDAVTINGTTRYRGRQIIRDVTIFDFAGYGIYISDNSDEVIINDTFVMKCGGPAGVYIGGQDVVIDTLAVGNCEKDGLHVTHGGNLRSINCDVFGNHENGIKIWDVLQCSFIKLTSNGNQFNDLLIKRETFMPSRLYFVNSSFFNCGDGYSEVMADGAQQGYGLISAFINCIFGIANRSTHLAKYAFEANTQYVLSTSFVSCVFNENNFISFFNVDNVLSTYGCVCTDGSLVDSYARKIYQQNGVPLLTGGYYYTSDASHTVPNKVSFMAVGGTDGTAITLQKASTQEPGQRVTISNANSLNRTITVSTQSGDTLKGSNEIAGPYASGTFITDGTNTWQRI